MKKTIENFGFLIQVSILSLSLLIAGCLSSNGMLREGTPHVSADLKETPAAEESQIQSRLIHTGDIVILHVTPGKEFEKELELTVNLDGEILVPLVGWVKIENMTPRTAEEEIQKKLDKDFLVNPHVSLRIKEAKSRAVVLLGQLKKPGTYEFPQNGKMTLLEAVAKAEGFTDIANLKKIKLVRSMSGGSQKIMRIDAEKIISGDEADIDLEEGDLITVPESLF